MRIIQPDVARVGGISEALRIAAHAEARSVRVIPHCWSTDILVAATLHVIVDAARLPLSRIQRHRQSAAHRPADRADPPGRAASSRVPDEPGLGIELDPETLKRYRWEG